MMFIDIFRHSANDQRLFIASDCMITRAQSGHGDVADMHRMIVLFELLVPFDCGWLIAPERVQSQTQLKAHTHINSSHTITSSEQDL